MLNPASRNLFVAGSLCGLIAVLGGCGTTTSAGAPPTVTAAPTNSPTSAGRPAPSANGPVTAAELGGRWKSRNYGIAYVRVDGSTVKIVYEHNDGRVLGSLTDQKITGWWHENPGPGTGAKSGEVQLTATRTPDGLVLHGARRQGVSGAFKDQWELFYVDAAVPTDVAAVLAGPASFVAHP